jgi:CBS domain-containing protein
MELEVVTLTKDEHLDLADNVMKLGRVRHLPILEDGRVVGIVSQRDLLAASLSKALAFDPEERRAFMHSVIISDVMSCDLHTIEPEATLRDAAEKMIRCRIGCLPVVENSRLVGIITETDLMQAVLVDTGRNPHVIDADTERSAAKLRENLRKELDDLRRIRDELRVQIQLGKAEVMDRWDEMEHGWNDVEAQWKEISKKADEPLEQVGAA